MKTKIQDTGKLEIAIVIALLVLVAVIILAVKVNQRKLPEKERIVQKTEERESISIKKLPISAPKVDMSEEIEKRKLTIYEEGKLIEERERFTEGVRQKQMGQLRKSTTEEKPATKSKHDIYPSEEDIKSMEKEKVLLY